MNRLEALKKSCDTKKWIAIHLKKEMDLVIIKRDLQLFLEKLKAYQNPEPNVYRIESMEIKIVEGNYIVTLEINDERGLFPFLWCFRIEYHNFKCTIYDNFLYQQRMHNVQMLASTEDENLLLEVEKIIGAYDQTIEYIQGHQDPNDYTYTYEFEEEKKACSCTDLFDVYETILRNLFYPKI